MKTGWFRVTDKMTKEVKVMYFHRGFSTKGVDAPVNYWSRNLNDFINVIEMRDVV
jgi:hypothetical protein